MAVEEFGNQYITNDFALIWNRSFEDQALKIMFENSVLTAKKTTLHHYKDQFIDTVLKIINIYSLWANFIVNVRYSKRYV
jgi:hypothetical protein